MFVEFVKDVPGTDIKVGMTRDVPDAIGRTYVQSQYGRETDALTAIRAEQSARFQELETKLAKTLTDAVKGVPHPPVERNIVEVTEPRGFGLGTTPADRDAPKRSGLGEITRCMYWARAYGDDQRVTEGMAKYGREALEHVWKLQRTQWTAPESFGISRDGSESTQGAPTYGYLVRPEFYGDVFEVMAEDAVITGIREIPMGQAVEMRYPALDQYSTTTPTRTSNIFGGVTLYRKPEDGARTTSDAKLSEIVFKLTDLTGLTKVSRDLLADAFIPIDTYLTRLFGKAFAWRRDWDFLQGTGAGEPMGILGSIAAPGGGALPPCAIAGGGISGFATRAITLRITYPDLAWMISKLWPASRQTAYWVVNAQAVNQLIAIQDASNLYVYQPNALITQAQTPSVYAGGKWNGIMMGMPVKFTEKVPALGSNGDITLFDPQAYGEATKAGIEVGLSEHRYFELDQVAIRWKLRNDGQPMWKSYITGADGNTYSPIVSLKKL